MADPPKPIGYLGRAPCFLGIETASWSLAQFFDAGHAAKALGFTSLLIKIADGTNVYYGGQWQTALNTVNATGIKAVPYTYCYGDKFGAEDTEDAILAAVLRETGIVIADMEAEFNYEPAWGAAVAKALQPIPGIFGVCTWADPDQQGWQGVLQALKPATNFWMPQVYSNGLAEVYHAQFDALGLPYYPIVNLGTQFGANDPVAIAKASNSPIVGCWEYGPAVGAYAGVVKQIIATLPQSSGGNNDMAMTIKDQPAASWFEDATNGSAVPCWHCTRPNHDFNVIGAILAYYCKIWAALRLPLTNELRDIEGLVYQIFEGGILAYDVANKYDNPIGSPVYVMKISEGLGLQIWQKHFGQTPPPPQIDIAKATAAIRILESAGASAGGALTDLRGALGIS